MLCCCNNNGAVVGCTTGGGACAGNGTGGGRGGGLGTGGGLGKFNNNWDVGGGTAGGGGGRFVASSGALDGILTCCGFFSCAFFGSPASLAFSFWVAAVVLAAGAGGATTGTGCWLVVLRCAKRTGGWPALLVVGAGGTTLQSNVVPPLDNVGITIPFQALQRASACDPAWQYRKAEQSLPGKYWPARHMRTSTIC